MVAKTKYRAGNEARPGDIFIALMGVTGSGKSSFIENLADGKKPKVGHSLASCTTEVDVFPYKYSDESTVYLIDTPGFNDTEKSDTAVLCELASWLTASYSKQDIKLHGVIYLHNITETRMQGSMRANLGLLKNLVGAKNLKNVVLTTTRWDIVEPDVGERREKELIKTRDFWGDMIKNGSTTYRYNKTKKAARSLIAQFVQSRHPMLLDLQEQMVNGKMTLDQTPVGRSLVETERWPYEARLKETQTLLAVAIGQKDKQRQKDLEKIEKQHKRQLDDLKKEHQRLKADIELLWKAKYAKLEQQVDNLRNLSPSPNLSTGLKSPPDGGRKSPKSLQTTEPKPQKKSQMVKDVSVTPPGFKTLPTHPKPAPKLSPSLPRINISPAPAVQPKIVGKKPAPDLSKSDSKRPSSSPRPSTSAKDMRYMRSKPEHHLQEPGFGGSFCLPFYTLEGPNKNFSNLPCKLRKGYKISLGANGHWVAYEPGKAESEIFTSPGFANEYLGLITKFDKDSIETKSGALLDISLGPDCNYWASFKKKSIWAADNVKLSACLSGSDTLATPEFVALGAGNAFVVKWNNGKIEYNIPGDKYLGLNRKHLLNNKDSGELKMVALDPDGQRFITVTTEYSKIKLSPLDDSSHFGIEEWLTLNAGIGFAEQSRKLDSGELVPKWLN